MRNLMILAAVAAFLTACGGGDPEPEQGIRETVAAGTYLGGSGKTHVNEITPVVVDADSTVTIIVTGEFRAPQGAVGTIYSRFSPVWSLNSSTWTIGDGAPAMIEIRAENTTGAEYRTPVRATYTLDVRAGTMLAAGIYFVDHQTAQIPGSLVNARTIVEIAGKR